MAVILQLKGRQKKDSKALNDKCNQCFYKSKYEQLKKILKATMRTIDAFEEA